MKGNKTMAELKTLANCSLREFLSQANKIRKEAYDFIELTEIAKIRSNVPEFTGKETEEERNEMIKKQGKKNFSQILDNCLEKNVDATIKMVGLLCFKTPEEAEQMDGGEFLSTAMDLFANERVMDFFFKFINSVTKITEKH